jgi:hypothetical protein
MFSNNTFILLLLSLIIFLIINKSLSIIEKFSNNHYYIFKVNSLDTTSKNILPSTSSNVTLINPSYIQIGTKYNNLNLMNYKYANTKLMDVNKKDMKQLSNNSLDKYGLSSYLFDSDISCIITKYKIPIDKPKNINKIKINYTDNTGKSIYNLTYNVSYDSKK